jgi:hypothetical protein
MAWTLAAMQPDPPLPVVPFVLGLVLIILGYAGRKTGVLTGPPRQRWEWLTSGYQGDEPPPQGINRESDPFAFYYIILCMYWIGALLILTAIVETLFF